jgi:hypothetical protein
MNRNQLPAAAILAAAVLLTSACGGSEDAAKDTSPSPSTASPAAQTIEYEDGVDLKTPEDVAKLEGAPEDFKQFISGAASRVITRKSATDKCGPYLSVSTIYASGFASGGYFECGGANITWAKVDGYWRQIFEGQYAPPCADFKKYNVPEDVAKDFCDPS